MIKNFSTFILSLKKTLVLECVLLRYFLLKIAEIKHEIIFENKFIFLYIIHDENIVQVNDIFVSYFFAPVLLFLNF